MLWNPGQLPPDWSLERLLAKHASQPANPDIANAFFRAGKIESWGRGIDLIRQTCLDEGYPAPQFNCDHSGMWVEFPFPEKSIGTSEEHPRDGLGEKLGEKLGETRFEIVQAMRENPRITAAKLAEQLGISMTAVENNVRYLRSNGYVKRIGPAKGGHWEVVQ